MVHLPAPLYLLRYGQIWRINQDGRGLKQISNETAPVREFDVSATDSSLAYIAGQRLIHARADGSGRRVLHEAASQPLAVDELAACNDPAAIASRLASPCFAADGARIAFICNGLHVTDVSTGRVEELFANARFTAVSASDSHEGPLIQYRCLGWAPDGAHLLTLAYRLPLKSLYHIVTGILDLSNGSLSQTEGHTTHSAWSPDGQYLFLANPSVGGQYSLLRFNLREADIRAAMLGDEVPARNYTFYAHPHCLADGRLLVFTGSGVSPVECKSGYRLHMMNQSGYGYRPLRVEQWPLAEACWATAGSGVLIVAGGAANNAPAGSLVWLGVNGEPAQVLDVDGATAMRWGPVAGQVGKAAGQSAKH
ncbi:MAG: TolB-like translocation protein [Anaerolineae bacterium]